MADKSSRPSWDEYFMGITLEVARRSTCNRAQVGAIIVRDKRILTTGYNGSPTGLPHCTEASCLIVNGHCVRTLHAEQNAIIQAALHGVSTDGATIYVTHQPCLICAKMIINAGISRMVYGGDYPDDLARPQCQTALGLAQFLEEAGVVLDHHHRLKS